MVINLSEADRELYFHLLEHLRNTIKDRYDYKDIKARLSIPDTVTNEIVIDLRNYFLDYVYPPAEKRLKLEQAFASLASYISKPHKVWRLIGSMSAAIFKFGRHFPTALKAGFSSLKVFQEADVFENYILKGAKAHNYEMPLSREQFISCITHMPRDVAENFIESVEVLLGSFSNAVLLEKTLAILDNVASKMRQYPHIYPNEEVEGIMLGKEIIGTGHRIFSKLHPNVKQTVVNVVIRNEHWFLDSIYV